MKTFDDFLSNALEDEPEDDQIDEGKLSTLLKGTIAASLYNKVKTLQSRIRNVSTAEEKIDYLSEMITLAIAIIATIAYKSFSKKT